MRYENFKTKSNCVRRIYQSATLSLDSYVTEKSHKILIGKSVPCKRKESKIVSDNTKAVESLGSFFRNLGTSSDKVDKKIATNWKKNSSRSIKIGATFVLLLSLEK